LMKNSVSLSFSVQSAEDKPKVVWFAISAAS
jgi:hypothetical protein